MKRGILIIEDEKSFAEVLRKKLEKSGYYVLTVSQIDFIPFILRNNKIDLILIDRVLKEGAVTEEMIKRSVTEDVPVVLISSLTDAQTVQKFLSSGAVKAFWHKQDDFSELLKIIEDILEPKVRRSVREELGEFYNKVFDLPEGSINLAERKFIAYDQNMVKIFNIVSELIKTEKPRIMLIGEVGTGKRELAHAVAGKRGVDVIFPGSSIGKERLGFIREEEGEPIYILVAPELLSPDLQMQLALHVMGSKAGFISIVSASFLSQTNRVVPDFLSCFAGSSFYLPPLRNRSRKEFDLFLEHFIRQEESERNTRFELSDEAYDVLVHYSWPFNLKELKEVIRRAIVLAVKSGENMITLSHLPENVVEFQQYAENEKIRIFYSWVNELLNSLNLSSLTFDDILAFKEELEFAFIRHFYREAQGNIAKMQKMLKTDKDLYKRQSVRRLKEME